MLPQILTFGKVVFDHQDFMANSEEALRHLYFKDWDNLLYSKAYALYSKPEFFKHVDYVLTQVSSGGPRFSPRGGANSRGGAPTYYLANFSRKLHENKEILGPRGGGARVPRNPM